MLIDPQILIIEHVKGTSSFYKSILGRLSIHRIEVTSNIFDIGSMTKTLNPDIIIFHTTVASEEAWIHMFERIIDKLGTRSLIVVLPKFNFEVKRILKNLNSKTELFVKPVDVMEFARSVRKLLPD